MVRQAFRIIVEHLRRSSRGFRGPALNRKPQMLPLLLYNQLERLSISTGSTFPRHHVSSIQPVLMTAEKDAGTPRVLQAHRGLTLLVFIAMSHANTIYYKSD